MGFTLGSLIGRAERENEHGSHQQRQNAVVAFCLCSISTVRRQSSQIRAPEYVPQRLLGIADLESTGSTSCPKGIGLSSRFTAVEPTLRGSFSSPRGRRSAFCDVAKPKARGVHDVGGVHQWKSAVVPSPKGSMLVVGIGGVCPINCWLDDVICRGGPFGRRPGSPRLRHGKRESSPLSCWRAVVPAWLLPWRVPGAVPPENLALSARSSSFEARESMFKSHRFQYEFRY